MTRLNAATLDFDEPSWRLEQRRDALAYYAQHGLPDPAEEVWRYAPLDKLDLDSIELASPGATSDLETAIGGRSPAAVVTVQAGGAVSVRTSPTADGLRIATPAAPPGLGDLVGADDAFAALNLALTPAPLLIELEAGAVLDGPVVVLHDFPEGASFPRTLVRVEKGGRLRLLEHLSGAGADLVAGVVEYHVGDGASLEVCTVQSLGPAAWSVLRTRCGLGRDATFSQTFAGLGGHYDRLRADTVLAGDGSTSVLNTAHIGTDDQVHDLRTLQDHAGSRTTSRLHSKAAVSGSARSIYSGLVRMRHGARKADSRQVNNSLVLSDAAQADAVPNLDIEENDVRCAHASTVGPVDAEQRWYLESRGIAPGDAVQLIIEGFFSDVEDLLDDAVLAAQLRDGITRLDADRSIAGSER